MSHQEAPQIFDSEVLQGSEESTESMNRLAMLHLSHTPSGTGTYSVAAVSPDRRCNFCGGRSAKRRSPSSPLTPAQEPADDAAAFESETLSRKSSSDPLLSSGRRRRLFTEIPLPVSSHIPSTLRPTDPPSPSSIPEPANVLRRCCSDPVRRGTLTPSLPKSSLSAFSNLLSPEDEASKSNIAGASPSPAKPPLPLILRRSVSDLTSSPSQTPPNGNGSQKVLLPPRTASPNSSSGEMGTRHPVIIKEDSPSAKKLKRMKEKLKEMSRRCEEAAREGGDEETAEEGEDEDSDFATKENGCEPETEETVSVEKVGDCFCMRFMCPCSKLCQIIISGKNCHYTVS